MPVCSSEVWGEWMVGQREGGETERGRREGGIKEREGKGKEGRSPPGNTVPGFHPFPLIFSNPSSLSCSLKSHSPLYKVSSKLSDNPIFPNELVSYNDKFNPSANLKQKKIDMPNSKDACSKILWERYQEWQALQPLQRACAARSRGS